MLSRVSLLLFLLLAVLAFVWFRSQNSQSAMPTQQAAAPVIVKQPPVFATHTFDPAAPPAEMPPLTEGEAAECESNFMSDASVAGQSRQVDATHAIVSVTQVRVTLQLNVTIWVPANETQRVIDHEEGHRQISEHFYQNADQVAERVAAGYIGRKFEISGEDLQAEFSKALEQMGAEITDEYGKQLNPGPTQQRYDDITDHSRNDILFSDAVAQVLKNATLASNQPAGNP